ncbi:hypothetical protein NKDENANG_02034 [Candidatus Entotheonellaceae bacterium PAL068K]
MRLAGKAATISGAARGMGAAETRLFAREDAKVVLGDILEAHGRQVEADIKAVCPRLYPGQFRSPRAGSHALNETRRAAPHLYERMVSRIPPGRYGQPDDVAYGVLYLASDESAFVTDSELVIDGGWTAQ